MDLISDAILFVQMGFDDDFGPDDGLFFLGVPMWPVIAAATFGGLLTSRIVFGLDGRPRIGHLVLLVVVSALLLDLANRSEFGRAIAATFGAISALSAILVDLPILACYDTRRAVPRLTAESRRMLWIGGPTLLFAFGLILSSVSYAASGGTIIEGATWTSFFVEYAILLVPIAGLAVLVRRAEFAFEEHESSQKRPADEPPILPS